MYKGTLLFLISAIALVLSKHALEKRQSKHYCGEKLNAALMLICESNYNKRGYLEDKDNWVSDIELPEWSPKHKYFPFRIRSAALDSMVRHRRQERGIVDECCRRSCTTDELRSYCSPIV